MLRTIPGCEDAEILRFGYAIEYDMVPPHQIEASLRTRRAPGLYLAGQINGTSGYEEAAGQGLMAGVNAALAVQGEPPFVMRRDESYIGVMIDDLITKDITEPYRLFTSRSEYRLLLRQDNADRRLAAHAERFGLLDTTAVEAVEAKQAAITSASGHLRTHRPAGQQKTWWELLRQPKMNMNALRERGLEWNADPAVDEALEIEAKYDGYLERQRQQVERLRELEEKALPAHLDYASIPGLGKEAVEKLARHRPRTYGQALRLDGVTPADISVLSVHLTSK
jgi:tRNA uridine 5-carboxymethylaminomethyl modification enzyme